MYRGYSYWGLLLHLLAAMRVIVVAVCAANGNLGSVKSGASKHTGVR